MQNYHKHTSYSNCFVSDCAASYKQYINRTIELGHKVISSVEHGFQGNYYVPYELVENHNDSVKKKFDDGEISKEECQKSLLKFVFGAEAYWVKDRHAKDRSNCHIILLAKNEEGRRDINEALADANIDGYYGQPRLDLELILKINPKNVFVTTACIAYWKYDDIEEITKSFRDHFKENFFLEVQCHNTIEQKKINTRIIELSKKYGIDIIFGYDSHYILSEDSKQRDNYISTRRKNYKVEEDSESGWYMDYPNETVVRKRLQVQGILTDEEIDRCIKNTDLILEFDDLYFDKEIKLPDSYPGKSQEWKNQKLKDLVYDAWNQMKQYVDKSRYEEYKAGIEYELAAIIDTNMADYFLIDHKIVTLGVSRGGIITKTGRGSGVSYYVNTLLGFSNIDRFISPVKLYPDRFMSKTRILLTRSLPDLDLNLGTVEIFAKAQEDVMGGSDHAAPMISYKPLQKSSAFKLYAKSQNLDFKLSNEITKQIQLYEKELKNADTQEEKDMISVYDFVDKKYHEYLKESKKYQGIINSKSQAPCGYLIYDGSIKREIGLIRCVSESTKKSVITTVIDGAVAEKYKFVKNDLLKVDVWLTINKVFEKIGIRTPTVPEITKLVENDKKTWNIYKMGCTLGVNQFDSVFARKCCTEYQPKNMQELTGLISALRPGFKTQLNNFLSRKPYTTGVDELDALLEDSYHYIMYQENIMTYLGWLGIEQTETYAIIKKISKKKFKEKELSELKERLIKGWISRTGSEEGFQKTWEIVEAFAKYAFNASHAYSYAYDSIYGAYLKAHYPYEFYSVMMQHYSEKGEKDKVADYKKEMEKFFGIKEGEYRFREDNRTFTIDKENSCITPSLLSIKGISSTCAQLLYEKRNNTYDSFITFLKDINKSQINASTVKILIKIGYFEEFGDINCLLHIFELFKELYGKERIVKEKAFKLGIKFEIIRMCCKKETAKTFLQVDMEKMLSMLFYGIMQTINTPLSDKIKYQIEYLGYIGIVDKKYAGMCVVKDLSVKYSPKILLYALANGNDISIKIDAKTFAKNPLKRGDIIHVKNYHKRFKTMYIKGEYIKMNEKEWWATEYEILERMVQ